MELHALGRYLRQEREARELTLEDAEQALRIRQRILAAFEQGDFDLPELSSVQIRGFIRNYARYLHLDEEQVIQLYEAGLIEASRPQKRRKDRPKRQDKRATAEQRAAPPSANGAAAAVIAPAEPTLPPRAAPAPEPAASPPKVEPPPAPVPPVTTLAGRRAGRSKRPNWTLRVLVVLAALSVIGFFVVRLWEPTVSLTAPAPDDMANNDPTAQPPISLFPTDPPTESPAIAALEATEPTPLVMREEILNNELFITIEMQQRTWLWLATDGVDQFAGVTPPGTVLEYPADELIQVRASNAGALQVTLNGERHESYGSRGQMI
ncbi:MAG: helix-turn-helix domain-containing protein, partial [Chloroflexi bacterium]|nr:helix-turn-helix domain-containing protein [Chloroflexota bacterium]